MGSNIEEEIEHPFRGYVMAEFQRALERRFEQTIKAEVKRAISEEVERIAELVERIELAAKQGSPASPIQTRRKSFVEEQAEKLIAKLRTEISGERYNRFSCGPWGG